MENIIRLNSLFNLNAKNYYKVRIQNVVVVFKVFYKTVENIHSYPNYVFLNFDKQFLRAINNFNG